jgi:cobalamin biosynthesis protein CbiD
VSIFILASLAACAQLEPHPADMTQTIQTAKTSAEHEALAKHYEDTAKRIQTKIQEQRTLSEKYEEEINRFGMLAEKDIFNTHQLRGDDESYYFAKQAEARKVDSQALIRSYQKMFDPKKRSWHYPKKLSSS